MKNRLERTKSNDTTSCGSDDVTVIEGNVPEEIAEIHDLKEESRNATATAIFTYNDREPLPSNSDSLQGCLLRRDSARASIKKKVRCSETAEVIPVPDYFINEEKSLDDDDDVFSDTAPIQTPRGNMCTPYIERKGSLPAVDALPDWFPDSRLIHLCHSRFQFISTLQLLSILFR